MVVTRTKVKEYGKKEIFESRFKEGYELVSWGQSTWIHKEGNEYNDTRIVSMWAFYHPDGRIHTYQQPKIWEEHEGVEGEKHEPATRYGTPFEAVYTSEADFDAYLKKRSAMTWERESLANIIKEWERLQRGEE